VLVLDAGLEEAAHGLTVRVRGYTLVRRHKPLRLRADISGPALLATPAFRPYASGDAVKLFHCIVVMGAAMGAGCGGRATSTAPSSSGGGSSGSAGGTFGGGGDDAGDEAGCPDSSTVPYGGILVGCQNHGPCVGTLQDPQGPAACATPQGLVCGIRAETLGLNNSPHGCACIVAPLSPADCPQPYQFECDDWTQSPPCGCWCDPNAPVTAGDCGDASMYPGKEFVCHSYSPPVGCQCFVIPPPIL
jgi:hypothetical protein